MFLSSSVGALGVSLSLYILFRKWQFRQRAQGCSLPPSRPARFLLGHALEIPTENEARVFQQWAEELGSDIYYIDAAGTPIVVLNTIELANELFEGRSAIYSSRPGSIMMNDLMGWDWVMSNMPYGQSWRERRKLFQQHLHPSNRGIYEPYEQEQVNRLLARLLDDPQGFLTHARHVVGGLALTLGYGLNVKAHNDPHVEVATAATKAVTDAAVPGAFFVDFIPALRYVPEWFPGAGFQKKARIWKGMMEEMRDRPFEDVEAKIASGIPARPNFVSAAFDKLDPSKDVPHQRQVIRDTAGMIFAAASDTTTSVIQTFFLAMVCYPQVQRRAQEELDRVLGGRLPEVKDEPDLPYISAMVKEVLRWRPATPIGIPHLSTSDDIFKGYFIPKGTIVIPNVWAMLHNPEVYPNPDEFNPDRYLKDGAFDPLVRDPGTMAFGFGRRTCAGAHIAESMLFLTIASVLSAFSISKPVDENGKPVDVKPEYNRGIISRPVPFESFITPRSAEVARTIRNLQESDSA
ncbi:cytochrome P450 [Coprinopsis marcescibilis]|uniref:Cytochrome P450 n=1 Tax=Coprinopsis marcescibilis TaxID=230819 RepID=A0A5C3KNK4_COPMA|nr:cytochrome P450 [Coprinopsis marcescibilis]